MSAKCPRCVAIVESQILVVESSPDGVERRTSLRHAVRCPRCRLTVLGDEGMQASDLARVLETQRDEIAREAAS